MKRKQFTNYLKDRGCELDFSHEDHDVYTHGLNRKTVPIIPEVSDTLVMIICRSLNLPNPPQVRYQPPPLNDRDFTFGEAEEILRKREFSAIRWEKFKYTGKAVSYVDRKRLMSKTAKQKSIRKPYFWVPCAFDGDRGWQYEPVAPHWLKTRKECRAFIKKHWRETQWPCEQGEVSTDSVEYLNEELGLLKTDSNFKFSSDIPQSSRERALEVISDLGVIGSRYLAKAIANGLPLTEPTRRQLSEEKLLRNEVMSGDVDKTIPEIIELAFRAGRVAERRANHYRGGPFVAQKGIASVRQQGKGRRPRRIKDLSEWETQVHKAFKQKPETTSPDMLDALKKTHLIKLLSNGKFKWKNEKESVTRQSAIQRISRLRMTFF